MLNTNYSNSVSQYQCRRCHMWGNFSHIHNVHSLLICCKKDLSWLNNQGFNSWGRPLLLRANYRCVQSPIISVDVAKRGENLQTFTQFTHTLSITKNGLSWLNKLFMVRFQLIRMSSYAKNKLQMCLFTQHLDDAKLGIFSNIHPVLSLIQKMYRLDWTIYSW